MEEDFGANINNAVVTLSPKQITQMKNWAQRVGLNDEIVTKMQEKYGSNSYNMMLRALMEPAQLTKDIGIAFMSSKKVIQYMVDNKLTAEQKSASLRGEYGTYKNETAEMKQPTAEQTELQVSLPEITVIAEKKTSDAAKTTETTTANTTTSGVPPVEQKTPKNFSATQMQAIYNHVLKVRFAAYKKRKKQMPDDTKQIVDKIIITAQQKGVDPCLALAVAEKESVFISDVVSPAGAVGIFQIMPAKYSGFQGNRYDAMENIVGGINMLKTNINMYKGDLVKGLKAYNWGCGNLNKALKSGKSAIEAGPQETREYAPKVLRQMDEYCALIGLEKHAYDKYYGIGTTGNVAASALYNNDGRV